MIRQLQCVSWAEVPGYNGLYLISEFGNVYNTRKGTYLQPQRSGPGRTSLAVKLSLNGTYVQRSINKLIQEAYGNIRRKTHGR